jgi:hypothetical protein
VNKILLALVVSLFSTLSIANITERSPFTDVIYDDLPSVTVQVYGEEYYLLAVNGVRRAVIMDKCESVFAKRCQFMFAEHFTSMMSVAGVELGETVTLDLYKMQGHQVLKLENVPVTAENQEEVVINRALRGEE